MDSIRIVVVGAGAIGGVTAALMKQGGSDVTLVCKHQEIADIASGRGLHITGVKGEHTVHLNAVADIAELDGTYDVALIATKAYDMPACARARWPRHRPPTPRILSPSWSRSWLRGGMCFTLAFPPR